MHCPFCSAEETKVIDSRLVAEGHQVRRRRECLSCNERFTTFETAELVMPRVIKSDGTREPFNEQKLRAGIVATGVRNAAILGVIAFVLLFASIVALLVGLIHVLEPLIGPLGATLAVFGAGLVITIILALLAKGCITRMKKAIAP